MSVILLKGINVGKGNRFDTKNFAKELSSSVGLEFFSYLASGNFYSKKDMKSNQLLAEINLLSKKYSLKTLPIVLNNSDFIKSVENIPEFDKNSNPSHIIAYYSNQIYKKKIFIELESIFKKEKAILKQNVLYINYRDSIAISKITTNEIDKIFNIQCTGRNLNTIRKIQDFLIK